METEPVIIAPDGSVDIGSQLPDINSMISSILGPAMWFSLALTFAFVLLYFNSLRRRRKLENAIFDMQKTLNEMNERDKARSTPTPLPKPNNDRVIALE